MLAVAERVTRVRLLYLYPSGLTDGLIDAMGETGCPYFDLSLQHVSPPHLRRMRRWGSRDRFVRRIDRIRAAEPQATLRSSFIVGYPGETEEDHDQLLAFLAEAELDWAGFFPFSPEEGTYAHERSGPGGPRLGRRAALPSARSCRTPSRPVVAWILSGPDQGPGGRAGRRPQPP